MNHSSKTPAARIAAFFDLDGTVLPAPSLEWRFVAHLLSHDEIPDANIARWLARCGGDFLRGRWGSASANKIYLAGLRESLVSDWERAVSARSLPIFARSFERICWHLAQQHSVFFVTGTLEPLARVVARMFPGEIGVRATRLEACEGYWTGFVRGTHMSGAAKAVSVRAIASQRGFDLARSFAYGNEISDLAMLDAVGHATAVNPTTRLERVAQARGWRVLDWRKLRAAESARELISARGAAGATPRSFSPRLAR
jgi:phosphoserine phosphatase